MTQEGAPSAQERIIGEVLARLESGGPDAVVLREVARGARVSLRDVYQHFGSRDELIVTAVAEWMDTNVYRPMAEPADNTSLYDALLRQFRHVFEPWEQNPRLLDAFVYGRSTAMGARLLTQGEAAAGPTFAPIVEGLDASYVDDVMLILTNLVYALMGRVAAGQLPLTEIMPTIERVIRRLTVDVPVRAAEG